MASQPDIDKLLEFEARHRMAPRYMQASTAYI
jgi:hypothetical protein